jgi:hypothetical protein
MQIAPVCGLMPVVDLRELGMVQRSSWIEPRSPYPETRIEPASENNPVFDERLAERPGNSNERQELHAAIGCKPDGGSL